MKQNTDVQSLLTYEKYYLEKGCRYICGVDEVGRGPLAGPVTVCAVIMDLDKLVSGVNDSKKLSAKKQYYVKVRTYKTAGGKKYYSSWSNVKSVKTK